MEQSPSLEANNHSATQEVPTFYATWRFITIFIRAQPWSLSWARLV